MWLNAFMTERPVGKCEQHAIAAAATKKRNTNGLKQK